MASRSLRFLLLLLVTCHTAAVRVTPNSPCASQCTDSSTSGDSTASSSDTVTADIPCEDSDLTDTTTGSKWKQCMSCLQNSTYSQGAESDQGWFLCEHMAKFWRERKKKGCQEVVYLTTRTDNLRYSFDYCVFAYPNGTGSGSNPCETSTACGTLKTGLEYDNLTATNSETGDFGYCDAGGGSVTGQYYQACLNCVSASGGTNYIANGQSINTTTLIKTFVDVDSENAALVALEAGCRQRPNATDLLGLSGSVFSSDVVQIVDPSTLKKSTNPTQLSTAAIAGIAAGGVALVALVAAIVFVRCRRRRNRSGIRGKPRWDKSHKRRSSFSFKCRNILASPLSPKFFTDLSPVEEHQQQYGSLDAQMSGVSANAAPSTQGRYYIESKPKIQHHPYETALNGWRSQDSAPEQTSVVPDQWNTIHFPEKKKKEGPPKKGPITINTTEAALSPPPAAHRSPRANQFGISPSATQYSPAVGPVLHTPVDRKTTTTPSPSQTHHHGRSPRSHTTTMSSQGSGYPSFNSQGLPSSSSPLMRQQQQQHGWPGAREGSEPWFPPPPTSAPPPLSSSSSSSKFSRKVSPGNVRRGKRESGSPVESKQIQVAFPAPPQR